MRLAVQSIGHDGMPLTVLLVTMDEVLLCMSPSNPMRETVSPRPVSPAERNRNTAAAKEQPSNVHCKQFHVAPFVRNIG